MDAPHELPHNMESLRVLVFTHLQTIKQQAETIGHQSEEISRLEHNNEVLRKLVFGKKSEKRRPVGEAALQGHLFFQELAAEASRLAERHGVSATGEGAAPRR